MLEAIVKTGATPPPFFGLLNSYEKSRFWAGDVIVAEKFGFQMDMSSDGNTVAIGATGSATSYVVGKVYIFVRDGINWSVQVKLTPPDVAATTQYHFGSSLALDDKATTLIVGAHLAPGKSASTGAAYVFIQTNNTWSFQAKLFASDGLSGDFFGYSVDISSDGNTAVIGARNGDGNTINTGTAYIFKRVGSNWSQFSEIFAIDGMSSNMFGESVAISGDGLLCLVSASLAKGNTTGTGAVYCFTNNGPIWTQQDKFFASDGAGSDYFGIDISMSKDGKTVIVGSYYDDDKGTNSGSAYIFGRSGTTWTYQAKLVASDILANDFFGWSVDISDDGNTAIIGAYNGDGRIAGSGSVYIYTRDESMTWTYQVELTNTSALANDQCGYRVSISGDGRSALVVAKAGDGAVANSGTVYYYSS